MKNIPSFLLAVLLAGSVLSVAYAQDQHHLDEKHTPPSFVSLGDWLGRAGWIREHILVSSGLSPMPEVHPASPMLSEPLERDGYTIQSVVLETYPGFYLTGNLYRPSGGQAPYPAVLSAHGHWDNGRFEDTEVASIPGRAIGFARQGYVVLTYSMVGYNENHELMPHSFDEPEFQLWGFSAMGLQLWNSRRALDFVSTLPDVDPARIGMTGASGGGTQTFMLTAIDERIKVAAPVNMISAHFQGGCICENAPSLRLDVINVEIGALAAPRPLIMMSTSGDWTTNTPNVEYPAIQAVYRLFGAEDNVSNVHLDFEHNYNRQSREAVYAWFNQALLGQPGPVEEASFEVEDAARLSAKLPAAPISMSLLFAYFRGMAIEQIERKTPTNWRGIDAFRREFGPVLRHALHVPEPHTPAPAAFAFHPPDGRTQGGPAALIITGSDEDGVALETLIEETTRRGVQAVVYQLPAWNEILTPVDTIEYWTTYNAVAASLTVASIRLAAELIQKRPDVTSLELIALGGAGPSAMMARALMSNITRTSVAFNRIAFDTETDAAFLDHLPIPIVRRAGDFRTAIVMTAPAELVVHDLPEGALREWMRVVYQAAGAEDRLTFVP